MNSAGKADRREITYWLGRMINRALSDDRESLEALCVYEGKVVAIDLLNTDSRFYMKILNDGVSLTTSCPDDPDVLIRTTPVALLEYIRTAKRNDGTASGLMEIRGDIGLAQKIQSIFNRLEPDWEEQLSMWTGDTLARKVGRLLTFTGGAFRHLDRTIRQNTAEYLLYETGTVVTPGELDRFCRDVDRVRDGAERLRVRLERLQRSTAGS